MVVNVAFFVMVALFLAWMAAGMPSHDRMDMPIRPRVSRDSAGGVVGAIDKDRISAEALAALIQGSGATVCGVEAGLEELIAGTTIFDPTGNEIRRLAGEHHQLIVLYCRTGEKSAALAAALREEGHRGVLWLDGGVAGWIESGGPVRTAT